MPVHSYSRSSRRPSSGRRPEVRKYGIYVVIGLLAFLPLTLAVFGGSGQEKKDAAIASSKSSTSYPPQLATRSTFAPTEQGAVGAATHLEQILLTADLQDEGPTRDKLQALTAPSYQDALTSRLDQLYDQVEGNPLLAAETDGTNYIARTWPVTYKIEDVEGTRAAIVVWSCTIAGIQDQAAPRISWTRDRLTLQWISSKWLLVNYEELTPIVPRLSSGDVPTSDVDFYKQMKGTKFYVPAP